MSGFVIDACCLINVAASGQGEAILRALGSPVLVPTEVGNEILYLAPESEDEGRTPIDFPTLSAQLGLVPTSAENAEDVDLFIKTAAELDDGEAMALTLSQSRKLTLLTDDRKCIRIATERAVAVLSTAQLVQRWSIDSDAASVSMAIGRIERLARYRPSERDPLAKWWADSLACK